MAKQKKQVKRALWSNAELFQVFLDVHVDGDSLTKYKKEELQEIAHTLGESVTDTKKGLIDTIIERLYKEYLPKYLNLRNVNYLGMSAFNYCMRTELNVVFCKLVIRDIERGQMRTKTDSKGNVVFLPNGKPEKEYIPFESSEACHNIVNRGFVADPVYDDIQNEINAYLWQSFVDGTAYILNGRIRFSTIDFLPCYSLFKRSYKVVSKCLSKYRLNKSQKKDVGEETVICSDNGNKETIVGVGSKKDIDNLSTMIDYSMVEHSNEVNDFFRFLDMRYPKESKDIKAIVVGRFLGFKDKETRLKAGMTQRTLERRSAMLKMVYQEYRAIDENDRFVFKTPERIRSIDRFAGRVVQSGVDLIAWHKEHDYTTLCTDYSNRIIEKDVDEKAIRYKVYKEYRKETKDRKGGHNFALIMMKKHFSRNSHGIAYAI